MSSSKDCLWLSQRKRTQLLYLFVVQRTGGKFGTRCILFSVFENIFSHTLEFSAVAGAKPSHPRPQNIFKMNISFKYPLLRGTRRSPRCTACKERTATWAPRTRYSVEYAPLLGLRSTSPHGLHLEVVSSYRDHRFVCGFLNEEERSLSIFS